MTLRRPERARAVRSDRPDRYVHYAWTDAAGGAATDAVPVVLVPGIGAGSRLFGTLPRRFARAGFPCVAFDPVGVPPSSAHEGPYDMDEAARDLIAVLDDLEVEACDLVGTSLGGKVSLCVAHIAPQRVRRVALLASAVVPTPRSKRVYRFFEILAGRVGDASEFGEVLATFLFGTTFHTRHPKVIDDIIRSMRLDATTRALMIAQARSLHGFDGRARAAALRSPCLCLAGGEDTLTGPATVQATAEAMPAGVFELIPEAGHSLLLEAPAVFERLTAFLGACATGGNSLES